MNLLHICEHFKLLVDLIAVEEEKLLETLIKGAAKKNVWKLIDKV